MLDAPAPLRERDTVGWARFLVAVGLTVALLVVLSAVWPQDGAPSPVDADAPTSTLLTREAAEALRGTAAPGQLDLPDRPVSGPLPPERAPADLFGGEAAAAVAEVLDAAGGPGQLIELAIYPEYLFVAYRATDDPSHIDRRQWRGQVGAASANPIDDRVDADTEPELFTLVELGGALDLLPAMVADAPTRYSVPVEITHVLIDRFLPFDGRVLVRVYARPADGRSGGGYVTYTTDGAFQKICC